MANKITNEDIQLINQLYYNCHNKAQVARETGFSASTVSKYIIAGWEPAALIETKKFTHDMLPEWNINNFELLPPEQWYKYCILTDQEKEEILELQKEVQI